MHFLQKYMEKLPIVRSNVNKTPSSSKSNILLYCNYYSFYSQKVLMALYEKNIDFEPLEVDITKGAQYSSWFLEINPRGEIPVLKVKDEIIPDSTRILDYLELYLDPELPPLINVSTDKKIVNNINKFRDLIEALPAGVITVGSFFHPHLCGSPKLPFILPVREVLKTGDLGSSKNLRKLADENPKARGILLYKAQIQDRKHEILASEDEYLKVLNVVDQVLSHIEEQLSTQSEGVHHYQSVLNKVSSSQACISFSLLLRRPNFRHCLLLIAMRKISKTRTEDDVISSTNGSIANDEQAVSAEPPTDLNEKDQESANESVDQSIDDSDTPPKKSKGNKRGRKKKIVEKEDDNESAEEEYEVEKVVDSKKIKGKLHYLIRWKGYSADSDTWEPENTLSCPDLINKYENEKENSKNKESKSPKKTSKKRKAAKETKSVAKRSKNDWDSKSADENAEYEVDKILEVHHKKNGKREFLIHWKGWSTKFDSWEPESNLNCPDLIKRFMDKVSVARSSDARNLRVAPETTNRFTLQDPSSGRRLSKRRGQRQRVRYDDAE